MKNIIIQAICLTVLLTNISAFGQINIGTSKTNSKFVFQDINISFEKTGKSTLMTIQEYDIPFQTQTISSKAVIHLPGTERIEIKQLMKPELKNGYYRSTYIIDPGQTQKLAKKNINSISYQFTAEDGTSRTIIKKNEFYTEEYKTAPPDDSDILFKYGLFTNLPVKLTKLVTVNHQNDIRSFFNK